MVSLKTITAICLGAILCTAQTINISGIIKDTAGVGISGAMVKLKIADISTTTGTDGSFTLTKGSTEKQKNMRSCTIKASPIRIQNGRIVFTLSEDAPVDISIHDVGGRQLYNNKRTYGLGTHAIEMPLQPTEIHLYKVSIGNEAYSFILSPFGTFSAKRGSSLGGTSALAKQAKAMAVIADVITVAKEGQLNYRTTIKTSDTSGILIKMMPNAGNVTDADGNVYQSVKIGNQIWTVENLKTTKYNDGTAIPNVTDGTQWPLLTTGAYSYYGINSANKAKFGALYNWYAVNTGKLAPKGWRVPNNADWDTLQNHLITKGYNWDETTSDNKIAKSMAAQTDWARDTGAGTIGNDLNKNNASGFSALPGGCRVLLDGSFDYQSYIGYWWSTTESAAPYAHYRYLYYYYGALFWNTNNKQHGYSVRLLRD